MLTKDWTCRLSAVGCAALLAVGCRESTGSRLVTVQVSLARADAAASAVLAPQDATAGSVDVTDVETFSVTLDSVQLATSSSQGWQTVTPTSAVTLNLLSLPASLPSLPLGTVTLLTGPCEARLFVSGATISFKHTITVGQLTFDPTPSTYDVRIPSGPQTGLKTDGECTVNGTTDVTLAFDGVATAGTIVATGNGIMLTPVIHIVQQ